MVRKKETQTILTAEPGKQEIFITREFDAPRELVFKAYTDAKLYVQWLGPRELTMKLETFEPTSGGHWRYIHTDQQGQRVWLPRREPRGAGPPSGLSAPSSSRACRKPGHVVLRDREVRRAAGRQDARHDPIRFQSVQDRDGMVEVRHGIRGRRRL